MVAPDSQEATGVLALTYGQLRGQPNLGGADHVERFVTVPGVTSTTDMSSHDELITHCTSGVLDPPIGGFTVARSSMLA